MRSIDIQTTQNVVISYEVAALRDRIMALILDWLILFFFILIVGLLLSSFFRGNEIEIIFMLLGIACMFYTLVLEVLLNGQTIGKKALRIRVIGLDGRHLSFYDYLLRWSFRLIDIFICFGALAAIMSSSTSFGQRLGGLVSNSTVVRLNPRQRVQLQDLLKISTISNYEPKYPAVRNFSEQDMLLVKQTLERYRKYKNDAHKQAVLELVEVMKKELDIQDEIKNKLEFLKTLIRDYIVLTR